MLTNKTHKIVNNYNIICSSNNYNKNIANDYSTKNVKNYNTPRC